MLHLVQRGGVWVGWGPAQSPHRCTKQRLTHQQPVYQHVIRCGTIITHSKGPTEEKTIINTSSIIFITPGVLLAVLWNYFKVFCKYAALSIFPCHDFFCLQQVNKHKAQHNLAQHLLLCLTDSTHLRRWPAKASLSSLPSTEDRLTSSCPMWKIQPLIFSVSSLRQFAAATLLSVARMLWSIRSA